MSRPMQATLLLACTLLGCTDPVSPPGPFLVTVTNPPPASAKPGATIPEVTLRFSDANGTPAAGRPVRASGDGTIELSSDVTDGSGRVRVKWKLPMWPQPHGSHEGPGIPGEFAVRVELGAGEASVELNTAARVFTAEQVDASAGFACGVRGGELWCWGGMGPRFIASPPWYVSAFRMTLPAGVMATEVRSNQGAICIRDAATDRPWCVGHLDGPTNFRPIAHAPALQELVDYGRGLCGRATADSRVWCWTTKDGVFGTAGPVETPTFRVLTGQSAGFEWSQRGHLCGLTDDGTAWCWGDNGNGELGDGTTTASSLPLQVVLPEPLVTLHASRGGACGETADGQVWCWGSHLLGTGVLGPQRVTLPGSGPVVPNFRYLYRIGPTGIDRYFRGQFLPRFLGLDEAMRIVDFVGEIEACGLGIGGEVWCSNVITEGTSDSFGDSGDLWPVHEP